MSSFTVVDVETANPDLASICQIGVVQFVDGAEAARWATLVDPEDFFFEYNTAIHGITEEDVRGAPIFSDLFELLSRWLNGEIVVSHTHFDRVALAQDCDRYGLPEVQCQWLDSARVTRRAWPDRYGRHGYGLSVVTRELGIHYHAHDAVEDAWAAGQILLRAVEKTGISVTEWLYAVKRPVFGTPSPTYEANPDGPLYGEAICFTGALHLTRQEASTIAAAAGCDVQSGVTKHTTLLVIGDQDIRKLAGHAASSKHRKALDLMSSGQPIRILTERDFTRLVSAPAHA